MNEFINGYLDIINSLRSSFCGLCCAVVCCPQGPQLSAAKFPKQQISQVRFKCNTCFKNVCIQRFRMSQSFVSLKWEVENINQANLSFT